VTPEQFLDARFPHLKTWQRSIALKAIRGEQMPISPIEELPLMFGIRQLYQDWLLPPKKREAKIIISAPSCCPSTAKPEHG
jgi:hypothetical protein